MAGLQDQALGQGARSLGNALPSGTAAILKRRLTPEPERALPRDPVEWVRTTLDEALWSAQRDILRALASHRKVAVQSCHQIGKSFVVARGGAWWIAAHPQGEAQIITTAPSGAQVRSILWKELTRAHSRGHLPGTITRGAVPEWVVGGEQVGQGRKPADYVDLEQARTQFQGIHARYLLGILDEACGVPEWLWEAMDTLVTNESSRLLAIGNPDDPTSRFARICAPGSGWHVMKISAFDSPNFTGEHVPEQLRESLISRRWVEETAQTYGEDSAYYTSKVLGEFPEVSDDVIISPRLIREAHERDRSGEGINVRERYGMDVARYGQDESCIYGNRAGVIRLIDAWRKADIVHSTERAARVLDEHLGYATMVVDVVGIGAGVVDGLRHRGYRISAFNGGEQALNPERFVNRSTEAWWAFREGIEAGLIDLDPEDETLAAQLQNRRWKEDASGRRVRIETKSEMAKRGVRSPDRADGAVQAYYQGFHIPDPDLVVPDLAHRREGTIAGDLLDLPT